MWGCCFAGARRGVLHGTPLERTSEYSPSSTTSLDRCSALESRLIRRKWSRILRLFESESDKSGPETGLRLPGTTLYAGFSAGSPVLRGRANRRVAHVPRDSRKAGQLLRAVAMCEKLPAYWRKLLTK